MKTIGVLGGMSWESSLEWYRLANQRVRQRRGGHHSARIVLDSVDFAEIEAMQARGDWHAAGTLLAAPVFPTTALHVEVAVDRALADD
jgi:aspartate racemase